MPARSGSALAGCRPPCLRAVAPALVRRCARGPVPSARPSGPPASPAPVRPVAARPGSHARDCVRPRARAACDLGPPAGPRSSACFVTPPAPAASPRRLRPRVGAPFRCCCCGPVRPAHRPAPSTARSPAARSPRCRFLTRDCAAARRCGRAGCRPRCRAAVRTPSRSRPRAPASSSAAGMAYSGPARGVGRPAVPGVALPAAPSGPARPLRTRRLAARVPGSALSAVRASRAAGSSAARPGLPGPPPPRRPPSALGYRVASGPARRRPRPPPRLRSGDAVCAAPEPRRLRGPGPTGGRPAPAWARAGLLRTLLCPDPAPARTSLRPPCARTRAAPGVFAAPSLPSARPAARPAFPASSLSRPRGGGPGRVWSVRPWVPARWWAGRTGVRPLGGLAALSPLGPPRRVGRTVAR